MSYRDRDSRDSRGSGTRVYVGDLPNDAMKEELEKEFSHFGRLSSVWVARNPPGFAFIEFEDSKDAEDAVADLDGRRVCGGTVKVEIASGRRRGGGGRGGGGGFRGGGRSFGGGGGGFRDRSNDKCYSCGESGHFARDCRSGGGGGGGGRSYGGGGGRSYGGGGGGGRSYNRRSRSRSRSESPRRQRRDSRSKSRSPKE